MKYLSCKDIGVAGCTWETTGRDEKEILSKAEEHAKKEHGMTQFPEDLKKKVLSSLRDAKAA